MTGRIFFTSDLHLGHQKVAEHRGFPDAHAHDTVILGNIVRTLRKGDILWVLGDISAGGKAAYRYALGRLNELTPFFDMHLVAGNHDPVHPMFRDAAKTQAEWLEVFCSVQPFARRRINGQNVWLSHFPWHGAGDRGDGRERHPEVRLHDTGTDFLLHGHRHSDTPNSGPRSYDVGLDAWNLHPVPLTTFERIIPRKPKP